METGKNMKQEIEGIQTPSRHEVWKMFDRIARRYDLLNRLLSFGRDVAWRRQVASYLPPGDSLTVLDIATGTGDLLISVYENSERVKTGVGIDMAVRMLELGEAKIAQKGLSGWLSVREGDARAIPFPDRSYDAVTIAFGIRNVDPVETGLAEMRRVLKPGGRALILEFSLPENWLLRQLYLMYFRYILPLVGGVISGDTYAYRYLNRTVETFPYGGRFCALMQAAGFVKVEVHRMTFGVASIYEGTRPD